MVVDHAGQFLDGVVEGLGVGALELEHGQHRLVPLGVLLLTVLGLVLGDRVPAAQPGVDVLLLGEGVGGVQRGERAAYGVPVGRAVAQVAQEGLEAPVVVEDQLDHVALGRPAQVDGGVCHVAEVPILGFSAMTASERSPRAALALVVGVTVVLSVVLSLLHLPSAVLFAALVGGMAHALTSPTSLELPEGLFRVAQGTIGVVIGAVVSLSALERIGHDLLPIGLVIVATLVISVVAGRLLSLRDDVSPVTGVFALIAGGASGVVAVAHDLGADDRVVTVVQYLRVLVVLMTLPLVTAIVFRPSHGHGGLASSDAGLLRDLVFVAVSLVVGLALARLVRFPTASLLGPLAVAVLLALGGWLGEVRVPTPVQWVAFAPDRRAGRAPVHPGQPGLDRPDAARRARADLRDDRGHRRGGRCARVGDAGRRADGVPRDHAGRAVRRPVDGVGRRVGRDLRARGPALPAAGDPRPHPSAGALAVGAAQLRRVILALTTVFILLLARWLSARHGR